MSHLISVPLGADGGASSSNVSVGAASRPPQRFTRSGRRLALHIPNSIPRSPGASPFSTRASSPQPSAQHSRQSSPERETREADAATALLDGAAHELRSERSPGWLETRARTAESSRDFLARERTFLAWLKLSMTLAVVAATMLLRLRLKVHPRSDAPWQPDESPPSHWHYSISVVSTALGLLFFLLSLASLVVGCADYLRVERALERADVVLSEAERTHDRAAAGGGHSGAAVRVLTGLIALSVGATALFLLVADSDARDTAASHSAAFAHRLLRTSVF
ncbi:hypothetical protein FA09DRAFT_44159 [Tilletiopsis washingtonensis]|uniref:DUF202 domain-containing protein n=1 Tax=Tilletiopsis washingtonensis TaxID=58919 RepID=A0A316Z800_9BASI|nr:hypothetical protein FA09DRAFT_44159 [Tilletiopsis washingtonensis]PWN97701.1 hypothetical protein FA09DRAFT_44159 [Tilletiopsis washingtonensis]